MLGENLKRVREGRGMTQEELAERVHVVRQTVSKWEKGLSVPDADVLVVVAETLGVSVADLIGTDAVQAKSIEELSVQTAVLNEQIFLQNHRMEKTMTAVKRVAAACALAVILVVGMGAAIWLGAPTSYSQITVEYEIDGAVREAHININTARGESLVGYDWPSEDSEIFKGLENGDLGGYAGQSGDAQMLLHAMEVAIEDAGGEVKRISSMRDN